MEEWSMWEENLAQSWEDEASPISESLNWRSHCESQGPEKGCGPHVKGAEMGVLSEGLSKDPVRFPGRKRHPPRRPHHQTTRGLAIVCALSLNPFSLYTQPWRVLGDIVY